MHQATIISRKEKRAMFGRVTLPNIAVYLTVNFAMFFSYPSGFACGKAASFA